MDRRRRRKPRIREDQLRNWKLVESFRRVLAQVYRAEERPATLVDPRRQVGVEPYLSLFLLGLYNPVVDSMRGLCAASELERVQESVGGRSIHPSTFSEMQGVLDPEVLHRVFRDLAAQMPVVPSAEPGLRNLDLVAQDGSLWGALPRAAPVGQSAAQAYTERPRLRWSRRQRRDIFVWIGTCTKRMLRAMDDPNQLDVRRAWLRRQGLIEVAINQQPVTPFSPENGS